MRHTPLSVPADFAPPMGETLWVFAYGSLMWSPGFAFQEKHIATLRGYHRRFCISSHRYRGTPEQPGLVLGLDYGGTCHGVVYRVAADDAAAALDYLWQREMITHVYRPRWVKVLRGRSGIGVGAGAGTGSTGAAGDSIRALAFVVDRGHAQYCGRLNRDDMVHRVVHACGDSGPNLEYLINTVEHLRELRIHDSSLEHLLAYVLAARASATAKVAKAGLVDPG